MNEYATSIKMRHAYKIEHQIERLIRNHNIADAEPFLKELKFALKCLKYGAFTQASTKFLNLRDWPFEYTEPCHQVTIAKINTLLKLMSTTVIPDMIEDKYESESAYLFSPNRRFDHCSTAYYEVNFMRHPSMDFLAAMRFAHETNTIENLLETTHVNYNAGMVPVEVPDIEDPTPPENWETFTWEVITPPHQPLSDTDSESLPDLDAPLPATPPGPVLLMETPYIWTYVGPPEDVDPELVDAIEAFTLSHPPEPTSLTTESENIVEAIYWKTLRNLEALKFFAEFDHLYNHTPVWTIFIIYLLKIDRYDLATAFLEMPTEVREHMFDGIIDSWAMPTTPRDTVDREPFFITIYKQFKQDCQLTHDEAFLLASRMDYVADKDDRYTFSTLIESPHKIPYHNDTYFMNETTLDNYIEYFSEPFEYVGNRLFCFNRVHRPRLCMSVL